ncbi:hypothetical protein, partial [Pseudomonas sp. NW5]|uniref:hypothetical protein n=1 Tax=Pseudomonas sp. NW5 TaxID=2934934 RepID=UPI0020200ED1
RGLRLRASLVILKILIMLYLIAGLISQQVLGLYPNNLLQLSASCTTIGHQPASTHTTISRKR